MSAISSHWSPALKRSAPGSPPLASSSWSSHRDKRARPNLANGFSGLSISPLPEGPAPGTSPTTELEDEEAPRSASDVQVEELPARPSWSRSSHASSSASEHSADEPDDEGFRPFRRRRVQHPDGIEYPNEAVVPEDSLLIEEIHPESRKRRQSSESGARKRSRESEDVDMDEAPERKGRSYEIDKDRIYISSLSDTSSDRSRSPSPTRRQLAQPGVQGFTLSPSLLTHLIASHRDQFTPVTKKEQGLVLYRPPPVIQEWNRPPCIVQEWTDEGRFEELDEDDHMDVE